MPAATLNPADFGIGNGVDRPMGLPQMIVAGGLTFRRAGRLPAGTGRHALPLQRHADVCRRPPFDARWRRIPALPERQLRRGHRAVQLSQRAGVHRGNRQRVQHHAGRAAEPHHPGRRGVLRSGPDHDRPQPDTRSRPALRMARHADRTGRPVRRVRRGHARRWCASASTSTRSIGRTTRTSSRASGWRGRRRPTAAPWCAPRIGWAVDQPSTTVVRDTAGNPPFAIPLTASGSIALANAVEPRRSRSASRR